MKTLIKKCPVDGIYTTKGFCPKCNERTLVTDPPKFSPEDKYGSLRRKEKSSGEAALPEAGESNESNESDESNESNESDECEKDCGCN